MSTKLTVYRLATGEALLRWPVDAKEMVASGEYSLTPPPPVYTDVNTALAVPTVTRTEHGVTVDARAVVTSAPTAKPRTRKAKA